MTHGVSRCQAVTDTKFVSSQHTENCHAIVVIRCQTGNCDGTPDLS